MNLLKFALIFALIIFVIICILGAYGWTKDIIKKHRAKKEVKKDV